MANPNELATFSVKSYRYLRLSIVVVVTAVLASVVIERTHVDCWQGSISAYYYTPVQAVFVGALLTIGVSLIAIKGSTDLEDTLLNVAGVLAPIVAFVPTSSPARVCASAPFVGGDTEPYIDNNVLAFAIGGALAIILTIGPALVLRKAKIRRLDPGSMIGVGLGAVLLVAGLLWYGFFRDSFLERAHGGAAIAMFFFIWIVMVINARTARPAYRKWYAESAIAMAVSVVVVVAGKVVDSGWRHQILWLEVLVLTAFAVFWIVQTFEHWDGGVPTGTERTERVAEGPLAAQMRKIAPEQPPGD